MFSFVGCFVVILLSVFKFTYFLAFFFLFPTNVCYASGSLLLLYIPASALFSVVPLCPILSPTAPNKAREQPLSLQRYKPFSVLTCMTSARFHLHKEKLFVYFQNFKAINWRSSPCYDAEKQQWNKLNWDVPWYCWWNFEVVFCNLLQDSHYKSRKSLPSIILEKNYNRKKWNCL